jgi:hypothetical protein
VNERDLAAGAALGARVLEGAGGPPGQDDDLVPPGDEGMPDRLPEKPGSAAENDSHGNYDAGQADGVPPRPPFGSTLALTGRLRAAEARKEHMRRREPGSAWMRGLSAAMFLGITGLAFPLVACGPKSATEAETQRNVDWLAQNPTGESIAALGRLADSDPRAIAVLEGRAAHDINVYIAAWSAVTRGAAWGTTFVKASLADPSRAELISSALPRKDARLVPFISDLDGAVVRLAAGKQGSVMAGLLASIGPPAHSTVEKRLIDPKTRGAMCDGIALPESSGDAKSVLLAVTPEARDNPSCVTAVMDMAATEDVVVNWIANGAESGLIGVAAKSTLACPRLAAIWKRALVERTPDASMTVPLQRSIARCATAMDPVVAELLRKAPRARPTIVSALDPFGTELASLKETCKALKQGHLAGESAIIRERANDAILHGCALAR